MHYTNLIPLALPVVASLVGASPIVKRQQRYMRSSNYGGVALQGAPDGSAFNYVTTQINLAEPIYVTQENSPPTVEKSAAWIGFGGGDPNTNGILQTGCSIYNDGQQDTWARCWYEFYPAPPVFLDNSNGFVVSVDDNIKLELTRTSDTTGHAKLTNLGTGDVVDVDITAPDGSSVSGYDAEWIVENPGSGPTLVNFQKQFFEGCGTTTAAGNNYGPGDGNSLIFNEWKDLGDGNGPTKWTNAFIPSESEVEVDFVANYS